MRKLSFYLSVFLFLVSQISYSQTGRSLIVGAKAPQLSGVKWIKGDPVLKWNSSKIYLLEFGATWCTPCAAAIPELSALQDKYRDQLIVMSIFVKERNREPLSVENPLYIQNVVKYVGKRKENITYSVGVDNPYRELDKTWLNAAGLSGIPHMFIIDQDGVICWIGSSVTRAATAIASILERGSRALLDSARSQTKVDSGAEYDRSKLLLIDDNGGKQTDFLFRSLLTRYDGTIFGSDPSSIQSFLWRKPDSIFDKREDKFEVIGASIGRLYYLAYSDTLSNVIQFRNQRNEYTDTLKNPWIRKSYGKYWHEPILEVSDLRPFEYNWNSPRNRYNYSLKVPKGTGTARFLQSILRNDLDNYFGYSVKVETRLMPYWKLWTEDKTFALSKLKSADQSLPVEITAHEMPFVFKNAEMRDIIVLLASTYGYGSLDYGRLPHSEQGAFIDKTGITEKIDFTFDKDLTFEQMQLHLRKLGLMLSKDYKYMKVVVISDSQS